MGMNVVALSKATKVTAPDAESDNTVYGETPTTLYTVHCMQYGGWAEWNDWLVNVSLCCRQARGSYFTDRFDAFFTSTRTTYETKPFPLTRVIAMSYMCGAIWAEEAALIAAEMREYLPLVAALAGVPCPTEAGLHHRYMNFVLHPPYWYSNAASNVKRSGRTDAKDYEQPWAPGCDVDEEYYPFIFYVDMLLSLQHASDGGGVVFT
jgi:hypothetical protein